MSTTDDFARRYGALAVVAGAAEGLGAAFARSLAARGLDLLLCDTQIARAETLARELSRKHGVTARVVEVDLASHDAAARILDATLGQAVGLLVYNAARSHIGPWTAQPIEDQLRIVDVNVRGLLRVSHTLSAQMVARGRGGLLFVGSNAGLTGHALTAVYGATKAFDVRLGEALWDELGASGVDVLVACPAAVRTPGYEATNARLPASFVLDPDRVAEESLAGLGRLGPVMVVGGGNRVTASVLRLLPRRISVSLMGRMMRAVYPHRTK